MRNGQEKGVFQMAGEWEGVRQGEWSYPKGLTATLLKVCGKGVDRVVLVQLADHAR